MEWLKQLIEAALKGKVTDEGKLGELISGIVDSVKKEIGKFFVPKDDFNAKNEELKAAKAKMDELQKQVEDLSKSGKDLDEVKKQLDQVKQEYDNFKRDTEKRETNRQKVAAIEKGLREAKASEDAIDLLVSQFDLDKIMIDNKGNIVDWDDHLKPVKESRKTLFGEEKVAGANEPHKGGKSGSYNGVNPWKKEHFNLTKQGEIIKSDPELAKKLANEAGLTL